jgi:hypothetical protein
MDLNVLKRVSTAIKIANAAVFWNVRRHYLINEQNLVSNGVFCNLTCLRSITLVISTELLPPFFLTRLVTIATLLRRYSPSPHPLLRLLSHVPARPLPLTNYNLLIIRFYHTKVVNSTRLYLSRLSRLGESPNKTPPKINLQFLKAHFFFTTLHGCGPC